MTSAAAAQLQKAFKKVKEDPVEGVFIELINDNLFKWRAWIEGPKETPYEGGIFQTELTFPDDYPMMPPTMYFTSKFWHPNVYTDGKVCISILHPPGDDPMSGEHSSERWRPTQTVQSILLSVISMLSDPNTSSAANVDASVEFRDHRDTKFADHVKKCVEAAMKDVPSYVKIPHPDTDPEERARAIKKIKMLNEVETNWLDDEIDDMSDDDLLDSDEYDELQDEDDEEEDFQEGEDEDDDEDN